MKARLNIFTMGRGEENPMPIELRHAQEEDGRVIFMDSLVDLGLKNRMVWLEVELNPPPPAKCVYGTALGAGIFIGIVAIEIMQWVLSLIA